jgi:hypothetical protein
VDTHPTLLQSTPGTSYFHYTPIPTDDVNTPKSRLGQHADSVQQAFSAAKIPTLQLALPAIEELYMSWEKASMKSRYESFVPALNAGIAKLNTYYERSAESDAHIMAMGNVYTSYLLTIY